MRGEKLATNVSLNQGTRTRRAGGTTWKPINAASRPPPPSSPPDQRAHSKRFSDCCTMLEAWTPWIPVLRLLCTEPGSPRHRLHRISRIPVGYVGTCRSARGWNADCHGNGVVLPHWNYISAALMCLKIQEENNPLFLLRFNKHSSNIKTQRAPPSRLCFLFPYRNGPSVHKHRNSRFFYSLDAAKCGAGDKDVGYELAKYRLGGNFTPILHFLTCKHRLYGAFCSQSSSPRRKRYRLLCDQELDTHKQFDPARHHVHPTNTQVPRSS